MILMPTRMDSEGLQVLCESKHGRSAFAVYVLLAEFAGTLPAAINGGDSEGNCTGEPLRHLAGVLLDDRGPYTASRLARKLPIQAKDIASALKILTSPEVGWLDQITADDLKAELQRLADESDVADRSPQTAPDAVASKGTQSGTGSDEVDQTELGRFLKYLKVPKAKRLTILQTCDGLTWQKVASHMLEIKSDESVKVPGAVLGKRLLDGDEAPALTLGNLNRCLQQGIIKTLNGIPAAEVEVSGSGIRLGGHTTVAPTQIHNLHLEG